MSRLRSISSNPNLRNFAQRSAQQAIMPVGDFIAPTVEVAIPTGNYKQYTEKSRFRVPDTRRPLHGRAVMVGSDAVDQPYNCEPHALDYPVDQIEKLAELDMQNSMQEGALICADIGALSHERAVIEEAFSTNGAGAGVNVDWPESEDPIADLDDAAYDVIKAAKFGSLMGIGIVFGAWAWKYLKNHPKVRGRFIVGNAKAGATQTPTLEGFGQLILGNPEVRASFMVYDNAPEGVAEDIQFVMDNSILLFARRQNPNRMDPSFMKTFRLMGQWMVPGSYVRDDGRVEIAKFDWSEDVKITNKAAGKRINIKR